MASVPAGGGSSGGLGTIISKSGGGGGGGFLAAGDGADGGLLANLSPAARYGLGALLFVVGIVVRKIAAVSVCAATTVVAVARGCGLA